MMMVNGKSISTDRRVDEKSLLNVWKINDKMNKNIHEKCVEK